MEVESVPHYEPVEEEKEMAIEEKRASCQYCLVYKMELYSQLAEVRVAEHFLMENPFFGDSFPAMKNIEYLFVEEKGRLVVDAQQSPEENERLRQEYESLMALYLQQRYRPSDPNQAPLNKPEESATHPRLYNVVTGQEVKNVLDAQYNHDMELVIKVVDLGRIYRYHQHDETLGNDALREVYNEIRVGFFLNELRYAYETVASNNFMVILDWFISEHNLYPQIKGTGPYQYIVSEKLDQNLVDYLLAHPTLETLKALLFQVAHALETAWTTHRYLHYDLHYNNVMLKYNHPQSSFYDRRYFYTRAYDDGKTYALPQTATHNALVKLIDYGRNRMQIPVTPSDEAHRNLYEHIDNLNNEHHHDALLVYEDTPYGIGVESNRTWDVRRLLWDLMMHLPVAYWDRLERENAKDYALLLQQCSLALEINEANRLARENRLHTNFLFDKKDVISFTIEDIVQSPIRELYMRLVYYDKYFLTLEKEWDRIAYIKSQASHIERKQSDIIDLFNEFRRWFRLMRGQLVWSARQTTLDATFLLSCGLFDSFIVEDASAEDGVWVGQRPYL